MGFDSVNPRDVRVIERGEHLRFAREPREAIGIERERCRQYFDGHVAIELRIARAIHLAHSPGAERREDFIGAKAGAGSDRHRWSGPTLPFSPPARNFSMWS